LEVVVVVDNAGAKELHLSAMMRSAAALDSDRVRQILYSSLNAAAKELGADVFELCIQPNDGPAHVPGPGVYESETDWTAE
jgi:hypothetical protein